MTIAATMPDLRVDAWSSPASARPRGPRAARLRRVGRVAIVLLLAILVVALGAAMVPRVFGATTLVVRSDSMGNAYPIGSLTVARPVAASEVAVGDVVLVQRDGRAPVLHRVIERSPELGRISVRTKGDANPTPDADRYALPERVPVAVLPIPFLGYVVGVVSTPVGWALLMVLPATLLTASVLVQIWSPPRLPRIIWRWSSA